MPKKTSADENLDIALSPRSIAIFPLAFPYFRMIVLSSQDILSICFFFLNAFIEALFDSEKSSAMDIHPNKHSLSKHASS